MTVPRVLLLSALLVSLGCVKSLPEQSPLGVSPLTMGDREWRVVDQVFVVTDASGTQYVNETFPQAKALTRTFVASMPAVDVPSKSGGSYSAGFIGFGGDDRLTTPLRPFDRGALASHAQSVDIMGSIDGTGGTTPLHVVLWEIGNQLEGKRGPAAIVVFTDGLPDSPEVALTQAQDLARGYADGVCIHAVQTGSDPEGERFLRQLASATGCGSTRSANSLANASDFNRFTREVFAGRAPLPPVAAASPCAGVVRLRGVEFAFDSAEVTEDSSVVLDVAVERLNACPELRVTVAGHTDAMGSELYNEQLSKRRAESVLGYLTDQGIPRERLTAKGYGESKPIDTNDTREGRARNRRVELAPN